ncbi:MAG: UDP-N-acetylmuramoyl-L-alanyl-D-glutamate--2,6-diaminopimelate ligase [Acidimicrobiales bacterium]
MILLGGVLGRIDARRVIGDPADVEIASITHDSRAVVPGALFCCVRGEHVDGHDLAGEAVRAGAHALLAEHELDVPGVVQVLVPDTRRAMGPASAYFYGDPSRIVTVAGVTGTAGKTTATHLLGAIFEAAGRPAGVVGTLTGVRTTPEAPELQATLAAFRDAGKRAVAMEVSSHALAMHRVDGTWFGVVVFTNLSRDHLDFHSSMEDYFAAKARLFTPDFCARAVVNLDDPRGRLLADAAIVPTVGYSLADADAIEVGAAESRFRWRGTPMRVPFGGRFNVSNALAAATAAAELGIEPSAVAAGLEAAGPVPGRFELVDAGQQFRVVVDYSHKPDGLAQVLASAREVAGAAGRVVVVFGCGGDRDRSKRPEMGVVAAARADVVVVTSDNPRSEDPEAIIAEIVAGIPGAAARHAAGTLVVEPDRRAAIGLAVSSARPDDVVVVAGKGHETTQTIGAGVVPFDDRQVARETLAALRDTDGTP